MRQPLPGDHHEDRSRRVAELRSRVHAMAEMHNAHHGGAMGGMEAQHGGMMMGSPSAVPAGAHPPGGSMMPPSSRAAVQDVDGGARIIVTPDNAADLNRLRSAVVTRIDRMRASGTCEVGTHCPNAVRRLLQRMLVVRVRELSEPPPGRDAHGGAGSKAYARAAVGGAAVNAPDHSSTHASRTHPDARVRAAMIHRRVDARSPARRARTAAVRTAPRASRDPGSL